MRLYELDAREVEEVVALPLWNGRDRDGKPVYEGIVRGKVVRVVIALDEPDLIVTIYPRR